MARKVLVPLDLTLNEIRNVVFQNLGSAPGSPVNGQFYYLTTGSHDVQARVNGAWVSLVPTSLLASANTWTSTNVFNGAVTGNNTINLTGVGASSVGGAFTGTALVASGLTGSTAASRYVGATASGAPASGAHLLGDFVIDQTGSMWICTIAGTPGTWAQVGGVSFGAVTAQTTFGAASANGSASTASRSDHTHGTPTHVGSDHSAISISSLSAPTADVAWGSRKITGLLDPTAAQDAATKSYVDATATGLDVKASVRLASTANVSVTYTATAGASGRGQITAAPNTLDGVSLAAGNRLLLKDQTTGAQNGIWIVSTLGTGANGVWDRATDFDQDAEVTAGAFTFVAEGTANADSGWILTTNDPVIIGGASGTALVWAQFSGAGQITAGAGLTKTGNTLDVGAGTGISVAADSVGIDTAVVARKFTALVGTGAATSIDVTHSLGNQWCNVQVFSASTPWDEQECDVQLKDANTVTLLFSVAPASNALRVVVTG